MDNNKDFERFTLYDPPVEPHPDAYCVGIDLPIEKTYFFTECTKRNTCVLVNLKESELEEKHKDLLIGEVIKKFENLPDNLKEQSLKILNERTK